MSLQEKWSIGLGLSVLSDDIKEYDENTVLITAPGCSSVKFMGGLSTTKHIVTEQWLQECNDLNCLISTSEYIVDHAGAAIQNGERLRASGKYLLSDMSLHRAIGTNGEKFNKPSYDELRELVEVSGGKWVSTQRKAGNSHAPQLLILIDDNDFDKPRQTHYIQALIDKGATKIRWCDLRDCLLAQSLEPIFGAKATTPKPRSQTFKERLNTLLTSPKTLKTLFTPPQMTNTPIKENGDDRENKESGHTKDHEVFDSVEAEKVADESPALKDNAPGAARSPILEAAEAEDVASSAGGAPTTKDDDQQETPGSPILDQKSEEGQNGAVLLYSTELKFLHRNLSHAFGARGRGNIGAGVMNISKSRSTGFISVHVINNGGLTFEAEVHPDFSGFFGNAGRENVLGWDAFDTSGNIVSADIAVKERKDSDTKVAHLRRFYFHFGSREHLTCALFVLFGGDDNARKLVEEFFDEKGRFCPSEEPELPHKVVDPNRMDIDDIDGSTPAMLSAPTTRVLFDNDPQEPSQIY